MTYRCFGGLSHVPDCDAAGDQVQVDQPAQPLRRLLNLIQPASQTKEVDGESRNTQKTNTCIGHDRDMKGIY